MEFLSRSWSLSASAISKALLSNRKPGFPAEKLPEESPPHPIVATRTASDPDGGHGASTRKWFGARECRPSKVIRKEKVRAERARAHAAVSVAAVAAAVAAVAAEDTALDADPRMRADVASATELLASHLAEVAEQTGAVHHQLALAVGSAVDVRTAGGLMTLTAAAATALRGVAAVESRLPCDARNNAAVAPSERGHCSSSSSSDVLCKEGQLLKRSKSARRWKHVSIHISRNSQVMAEIKGRHAFTKKRKCVVYDVCEENPTWTRGRCCFGLMSSQGLLEFECRDEVEKNMWVDGVRNLLDQVEHGSNLEQSMELLRIS